jgi:sugar lactone lactonase YvrE
LSPTNQAGMGSTNVTFTFDANSGATRTSTLTVAGQTLNITQAGSAYVGASPVATVVSSGLSAPRGAAVDAAGNVYTADSNNHAVKKWTAANNTVTTLVSSTQVPGIDPVGVALDGSGNVYIADVGNDAIEEWSASGHTVTTLITTTQIPGLVPIGVAVDVAGNVSIADSGNEVFESWSQANQTLTTLASSLAPAGVAVDGAGNVYMADAFNDLVVEWSVANTTLTPLVGASQVPGIVPVGVAVDGSGNVYIADQGNTSIEVLSAASQTVTPLVTPSQVTGFQPYGVAVDGTGNVYAADGGNNALEELAEAFVNTTAKSETGSAGSDTLPVVLPATENLGAPFVPTSNQSWLTIISTNNGVVTYGFTANAGPGSRSANIGLLGQIVAVSQVAGSTVITPLTITSGSMAVTGSGASAVASFSFTNAASLSFSVHATNNLTAPRPWPVVSTVSDSGGGHYHFTDPNPATNAALFYYLSQP